MPLYVGCLIKPRPDQRSDHGENLWSKFEASDEKVAGQFPTVNKLDWSKTGGILHCFPADALFGSSRVSRGYRDIKISPHTKGNLL